jgi:hypothetical protein
VIQLEPQGAIHQQARQLVDLPLHGEQTVRHDELKLAIHPHELGPKQLKGYLNAPRHRALVTTQPLRGLDLRTQPLGEVEGGQGFNRKHSSSTIFAELMRIPRKSDPSL